MIELFYFDSPGRAEPIRIALKYTNQAFIDHRLSHQEWADHYKSLSPTRHCPMMKMSSSSPMLVESNALLRIIATRGGLYPKEPLAAAHCSQITTLIVRIQDLMIMSIKDEENASVYRTHMHQTLHDLETMLHASPIGGHYCLGNNVSIADINVFALVERWRSLSNAEILTEQEYPRIMTIHQRMGLACLPANHLFASTAPVAAMHAPPKLHSSLGTRVNVEAARLAFAISGQPHEEVLHDLTLNNVSGSDAISPAKALPMLEVNGQEIVQPMAVLLTVGELTGLFPADALSRGDCVQILLLIDSPLRMTENDFSRPEEIQTAWEIAEDVVRRCKKDRKFVCGDLPTIADLHLYAVFKFFTDRSRAEAKPIDLYKCPSCVAIYETVASHQAVRSSTQPING